MLRAIPVSSPFALNYMRSTLVFFIYIYTYMYSIPVYIIQGDFLNILTTIFSLNIIFIQFMIIYLFLNIPKDNIFKFMIFFVLFKECPVAVQTSIFQITICIIQTPVFQKRTPLFRFKLFSRYFFWQMLMYLNQNSNK